MEDTMNEPECYIREEEEEYQLMEEDDEEEELKSDKQKGLRKESEDLYSDDSGRAAPIRANAFASAMYFVHSGLCIIALSARAVMFLSRAQTREFRSDDANDTAKR
jgi:hypothetical protein